MQGHGTGWLCLPHCECCCCSFPRLCPTLLWPHGPWDLSLLCPWDSAGTNTGMSCIPFSRGSLGSGIKPVSLALAGRFFYHWITGEALVLSSYVVKYLNYFFNVVIGFCLHVDSRKTSKLNMNSTKVLRCLVNLYEIIGFWQGPIMMVKYPWGPVSHN